MSDTVTFSGTAAHQPGEAGQAQMTEKQPEGEKPLTRAELMEALEAWNRKQQGLRAKLEKRITDTVERQLATLRAAGVEVTDAVRENLTRTVREQEDATDGDDLPGTPTESKPKPQASQPSGLIAKINAKRDAIAEKYGVSVEESDPEAQHVIVNEDPLTFLETFEAACKAKSARMKSPEARVPASMGGSNASTGESMEQAYRNEMINNRGKPGAIREVKAKYAKLGLDVESVRLFS